jgi:hypothetical protein
MHFGAAVPGFSGGTVAHAVFCVDAAPLGQLTCIKG